MAKQTATISIYQGQNEPDHPLIENSTPEKPLTRSELLELYRWKYLTLYRKVKQGLPQHGVGKGARYFLSEVREWQRNYTSGAMKHGKET